MPEEDFWPARIRILVAAATAAAAAAAADECVVFDGAAPGPLPDILRGRDSSSSSSCGRFLFSTSFWLGFVRRPAFVLAGGFSAKGVGGCEEVIFSLTFREPSLGSVDEGVASPAKDEERLTLILSFGLGVSAGGMPAPGADMAGDQM